MSRVSSPWESVVGLCWFVKTCEELILKKDPPPTFGRISLRPGLTGLRFGRFLLKVVRGLGWGNERCFF